jgi:DtxR family manganese transport transcriptional regulator
MTAKKQEGARHRRTRTDHSTELAEDYVEAIDEIIAAQGRCRVEDLRKHFSVTHVTVSRVLQRLDRDGLVRKEAYRPVTLTKKGKKLADSSRKRHHLVIAFLVKLGVTPKNAEIDAEGIEHHVSKETLEVMQQFVDGAGEYGSKTSTA